MHETELKIQKLINLCSTTNTQVRNLWHGDFLSDEIKQIYAELKNDKNINLFELWKMLDKQIKINPMESSRYYLWDIAVEEKINHAFEIYPEVKNLIDEEGLITVPYNHDLNKNGFKYKNHYLIFDNAFSRNFHFTEWLMANWKDNFRLKLPISKNLLGLSETRRNMMLLSHWQGPKHISNIQMSLNGKAYVVKGPLQFHADLMDKTEFLFYFDEDQWHFQIEELLPMEGIGYSECIHFQDKVHRFYTRYLHAIANKQLTKCTHIDGSIRVYDTYDNFKIRNNAELKNPKCRENANRYKLFRIDSKQGICCFQEIIGLFFKFNPYVLEFFEGESDYTKEIERRRSGILEIDFKYKNYQ